MKIHIYTPLSIHELGQRDNQEDAIAQWDNRLFVLCDGMGGHERGEVASQTVSQSMVAWFEENVNPDEPFTDDMLNAAIEYAYTELDKFDDESPKKMGTTLALLYIHAKGITAAHIGDSRILHVNYDGGQLVKYISRDHSLAFDLFQSGEITYDEIATFPQKNIVTRAMTPGLDNRMRPDIIHITDIKQDDWFILCSDGITENTDIFKFFATFRPKPKEADEDVCQKLIADTAGNHDNHTAWLIHIKEIIHEDGDEALENEELTARCNALNIIRQRPEEDDDVVIVEKAQKAKSLLQRIEEFVGSIMNKMRH